MTKILLLLVSTGLALSACGMNRAVGVLPNTLDDLENRSEMALGDSQDLPPKP